MDQGSLVIEEIDAGKRLIDEFSQYLPVTAAFWLKASDEKHRYLYIASDSISDSNIRISYEHVLNLVEKLNTPYLDPFRVKLIGSQDALAKSALEIYQRFPGTLSTRFGGNTFGGVSVDDVYIYPQTRRLAVS